MDKKRRYRRIWGQFTKQIIFMMFLLYPRLASFSMRLLVCQRVEGVYYLVRVLRS